MIISGQAKGGIRFILADSKGPKRGKRKFPEYESEAPKSCNPVGFEYIPIAKQTADESVPMEELQIISLRAEIISKKKKGRVVKDKAGEPTEIIRWTGMQNSKVVSLPPEWVLNGTNFHPDIIEQAIDKARDPGSKCHQVTARTKTHLFRYVHCMG